jgi:hypothetical protein
MVENISDEMAIDHFKKNLGKLSLEKQKKLTVVIGTKTYPFTDIVKHMEDGDEIGKQEIEIEKEYMRFLKKGR